MRMLNTINSVCGAKPVLHFFASCDGNSFLKTPNIEKDSCLCNCDTQLYPLMAVKYFSKKQVNLSL
jgi:hypothetical protein